jgi:hypothetical protein
VAITSRDAITIDIDANPKKAIKEVEKLTTSISDNMKRNQKNAENLGKGVSNLWKKFGNSKDKIEGIKKLNDQLKEFDKGLQQLADKRDTLDIMIKKARGTAKGSVERQTQVQAIKDFKKAQGLSPNKVKAMTKSLDDAKKDVGDSKISLEDIEDFDWSEAGETMAEYFTDFVSKDAPTIAKRIAKMLTAPASAADWGKKMGERGSARIAGAAGSGGLKKAGGMALGGAEKVIGGLAKGLAAIAPAITAVSGFMIAFIKILLDAESAAKEYNKQLLETTSTAGYLSRNMGNTTRATSDLQESLKAARDGAINFSNAQMGISKEVARSFQAAITAEGVALDDLGKATVRAKVSTDAHTKTIQMGVAFSRQFGVSLSDIAQTQGQLMADVGVAGEGVTASFAQIADGAEQAGMQANKFFGIVRSFSSDLSLFTLRLEDVTKIMGTLGKTMDPRKMGQFLQQLNQKFSGGVVENLKFQMMAEGGGGRKVMEDDLAAKFANISNDLKNSLGAGSESEIAGLMELVKKNDPRAVAAWTAKHEKQVKGPVVEAISKLMTQNARLASGDRLDAASVMEELSPLSKMEMSQAASVSMFGKRLEELSGIELAAAERADIASTKEIQMYKQFQQGILQGQEGLLARMKDETLTKEDKDHLSRMGIEGAAQIGAENAEALRNVFKGKGGERKYWDNLDKDQKDLIQNAVKARDFQAEAAQLQVSMNDKLEMISDILMNHIFKALEWIGSLFGKGRNWDKEKKTSGMLVAASRDATLQKAWDSGDSLSQKKTNAIESSARRAIEGLQNAKKEAGDLQSKLDKEKDPGKQAELEKRLADLKPALEMQKKYGDDVAGFKKMLYEVADTESLGGVSEAMRRLTQVMAAGIAGGGGGMSVDPGTGAVTPAASVGPNSSQAPAQAAEAAKEAVEQQKATVSAVTEVARTVANDGVKLSPATVQGPLSDAMAKSVYVGTAQALFEYFMYSGLDRNQVANAIGQGMSPQALQQGMTSGKPPGQVLAELQSSLTSTPQGNAMGGTVTGIMGNMAKVSRFPKAAPGEGWASVGRGEKIIPAGGGGGGGTKVQLELKGDLKRLIDARVVEGAAAHDRNKRIR